MPRRLPVVGVGPGTIGTIEIIEWVDVVIDSPVDWFCWNRRQEVGSDHRLQADDERVVVANLLRRRCRQVFEEALERLGVFREQPGQECELHIVAEGTGETAQVSGDAPARRIVVHGVFLRGMAGTLDCSGMALAMFAQEDFQDKHGKVSGETLDVHLKLSH